MATLTAARNALWSAITNWPALTFKKKYTFDSDASPQIQPKPDQCPAIAIFPQPQTADIVLNKISEMSYRLDVMVYTLGWNLPTAENLFHDLVKAVFQNGVGGAGVGVSYVRAATGFDPLQQLALKIEATRLEGQHALKTTVTFALKVRFNPQAS